MTFPAPLPGLVIRYSFLWSREARAGIQDGRKDRPCAIVVAVPRDSHGDIRVVVVPITHTAPHDAATAIALPKAVKEAIGLDADPAWVCLDELNVFSWPGYDLRTVPGTDQFDYGSLPQPLFERIRAGALALHKARLGKSTNRD